MPTTETPSPRDIVVDAIAHRDTGRTPYGIQYQPELGRRLAAHYGVSDISTILDNNLEWIGDRLSVSALQASGDLVGGEYTDDWGIRWFGVGETRGHVKVHPLPEPTLQGYRFPARIGEAILAQMRQQAGRTASRYRVAKLGALWEEATFVRGMADLLVDLLLHPRFVHELLDGIVGYLLSTLELYRRELPVDCIWLSDDYGSQSGLLMSPKLWRIFIRPRLKQICDAVHAAGFRFALHSDGAIFDVIGDVVDLGVDLLHPVQSECVDVRRVKQEYGRDLTLWGAYGNQGTLVFGMPAQVRHEVNALCDFAGKGGGFILSPGLSLQNETPLENAVAFIETAQARRRGRS
jgi:uroporphyrinogen decarboxylase